MGSFGYRWYYCNSAIDQDVKTFPKPNSTIFSNLGSFVYALIQLLAVVSTNFNIVPI